MPKIPRTPADRDPIARVPIVKARPPTEKKRIFLVTGWYMNSAHETRTLTIDVEYSRPYLPDELARNELDKKANAEGLDVLAGSMRALPAVAVTRKQADIWKERVTPAAAAAPEPTRDEEVPKATKQKKERAPKEKKPRAPKAERTKKKKPAKEEPAPPTNASEESQ